jgi:tripartite-type tricarboxylate transporter receptor subunit TctC
VLIIETGMKNTIKSAFFAVLAALLTLPGVGAEALGEAWPLRAVKLIVPLGPASGTDVTARLLADHLSKLWGKSVVVENRPGADGIVGIAAFLAGSPDDHVLLFAPTGTFVAQPFLHGKLSYNPDQLVPVARVTNTLIAVTVPTALNVTSLAELD